MGIFTKDKPPVQVTAPPTSVEVEDIKARMARIIAEKYNKQTEESETEPQGLSLAEMSKAETVTTGEGLIAPVLDSQPVREIKTISSDAGKAAPVQEILSFTNMALPKQSIDPQFDTPTLESLPVMKERKSIAETIKNTTESENTDGKIPHDRKFVYSIIKEIGNLLDLGKEIESLSVEKKDQENFSAQQVKFAQELKLDIDNIDQSIKALSDINEEINPKKELEIVMETYGKFIDTFSKNLNSLNTKSRSEANSILVKMNAKKAEITKMLSVVGDAQNFELIKKFLRRAEGKRPAYLEKQLEVSDSRKKDVSERTIDARNNDPHMFTEFTEKLDTISILQLLYRNN